MENRVVEKASERLRNSKQEVVESWLESVRDQISLAARTDRNRLIDNFPKFIEELVLQLQSTNIQKTLEPPQFWKEHAIQRATQTDLSLTDVIREYQYMRERILKTLWEQGPLSQEDVMTINKSIDETIAKSVAVFESERSQIRRREQLLASIFLKSIPGPFFIVDDNWFYIYINEAAAQQSPHRKKTELLGKRFWDIHPEAIGTDIEKKFIYSMKHRKPTSFEFYHRPLDQWYIVECYPNEIGIAVYYRDISAQKEAERQIEEQKKLLETVIENMPAGVRIHDARTGHIVLANSEADRVTGGRVQILSWKDFTKVNAYHYDGRRYQYDEYPTIRALHGETVRDDQIMYHLPNGKFHYLLSSAAPIRNEKGVITHVVAVVADIGKLKKVEEQLARSNRDLSVYSATVAHDLKSPISTIASMVDLLALNNNEKFDSQSQEMMNFIVSASKRMLRLIDNLLSYAKVGEEEAPFKNVSLWQVLDDVQKNLRGPIEAEHAHIHCENLPQVIGDEVQLASLFQNIISNAIKFRSSEDPYIEVRGEENPNSFKVTVKDNGIGFDSEKAEHIFEPFTRLHGQSHYEGTGLGLAICKRIVERHQGKISAHSSPGHGTVFIIEFPKRLHNEPTSSKA